MYAHRPSQRSPPPYSGPIEVDERAPLLPDDNPRHHSSVTAVMTKCTKSAISAILVIGILLGYYMPLLGSAAALESEDIGRNRIRRMWKREQAVHEDLRAQMIKEENEWINEKIERDSERARWEADEKKGRESLVWEKLTPSPKCLRYGTREYTAVLSRVPLGFDSIAACKNKSAVIHGIDVFPDRCEDPGVCGKVIGHWAVDYDEPMCKPWWGSRRDQGCDSNHLGKKRWEAPLLNLHPGDDWKIMCETTPIDIAGYSFNGAESCGDWSNQGIWGIWFVPDSNCA